MCPTLLRALSSVIQQQQQQVTAEGDQDGVLRALDEQENPCAEATSADVEQESSLTS